MKRRLRFDLLPFMVGVSGLVWFAYEVGWKPALALFVIFCANGLETHGKREWNWP